MVSKSEIFFLTGLFCVQLDCVSVEQLQIGNLALASSQQPGPLIGFGQNILGKKDLQFFCYVSDLVGCHKNSPIYSSCKFFIARTLAYVIILLH